MLRVGASTRGLVIIHIDAPRMRANAKRKVPLPIIRLAREDGTTIGHCHQIQWDGFSSLSTTKEAIPGYPTAICVVRTYSPVTRLR